MNFLDTGRWNLDHSSKLDILTEPRHTHLVLWFLGDKETTIERIGSDYILYGPEEALLVRPSLLSTRLLLCLFSLVRA